MDASTFETFGKIAGLAGLSLAVFLFLFRDFIRAKFLPTLQSDQAYKLIRLFLLLTTLIAVFGISVWAYTSQKTNNTSTYDSILDGMVVDFQSVADNFFIDIKEGNKNYSDLSGQYQKIDSKINSIIVRCNSLNESGRQYEITLKQAQILKENFERLADLHKKEGKLSPVFVDEVRKQYDEFSKDIEALTSIK